MHTLIITVPAYPGRDLDAFQRRVLEGLALGVLIVPEGTLWELAELPEPGRAEVRGAPPSGSGEEPAAGAVPFSGKCAKEKREIHRRLLVYREARGLGSLQALAAQADGPEESSLRAALLGEQLPMAAWRAIGRALDAAGEDA